MQNQIDTKHVGVLDGIRAIAVFLVANFHFWQQSWLWNLWDGGALKKIGIADCSGNYIPATGYVFVDMMILITGFCLFLPYARAMTEKTKLPGAGRFYVRRVARIMPSYYFSIIIIGIFFVRIADYKTNGKYFSDLFSHLTFTQMLGRETYLNTRFNGVLWTVSVEMLFYVMFPLLAKLFTKKPGLTYTGMCAVSWIFYVLKFTGEKPDFSFNINQFPTFMCVFANGMLAALIYVNVAESIRQTKTTAFVATLISISSLYFIRVMIKYNLYGQNGGQKWQIQNRYGLTLLFAAFILGTSFSFPALRKIFDNCVMRFLAGISYNFYIWHQFLAVKLKEWKIPYWSVGEGELPQAVMGVKWQWKYTLICWAASLIAAIICTYIIEKPLAKIINNLYERKQEAKHEKTYAG